MSEERPVPAADAAAALRQTGCSPLRNGDPGRVGPYVPMALLGSGGMGRVYLARCADDGPGLVAVKVIRPEYAEDPRFRRRFEREASVHARLRTPHAPRLAGTGFDDELLWMATEYLAGFDLAEAVREVGPLAPAAVWRLVAELGQALADLSVEGIVHRDLKPSNVLLSARGAHVIDFGIAKAADASALTGTGNRVGTPAYMSPEHLREGRSDTASDVFSLAGTLVYATAGRAPFGDGTGVDVMHRVAYEDPDPEVIGQITTADAELGSLLTACLAKEPSRRPTPQDLIEAAAAYCVASTWPQPLRSRVLDRQRACEALRRVPVAGMSGSGSPGDLPPVASAQMPESAPPGRESAARAADGPVGAPARARRKRWLVAVAGISACAVVAVPLLLIRQDPPAADPAKGGATKVVGTAPRGDSSAQVSPSMNGQPRPNVDGAVGDRESRTDSTPRPGASDSANDQHDTASAPGTAPSTTRSPSATADSPSGGTDTAPWLTECPYYSGNGRTRLGDSGKRVQQVQCMLTERGYSVGSTGVDGEFSTDTESAVQAFQSDRGWTPTASWPTTPGSRCAAQCDVRATHSRASVRRSCRPPGPQRVVRTTRR
ncbi:protein kinase domain-containing protein [Streptomyces sp. CA-249302]|uniref:protein kinase domain-containing protein n=1 Tax=Streptomyces sp. CA-249302 TaxID=3240058 RepID=UPI003D910904